jgi:Tol biopolymer transport system component
MRHIGQLAVLAGAAVAALGMTMPAAAQEPSAGVQLEQAMHVERVEGDLQRAIGLYQRVLAEHPGDREVGAKAQLHIGICYETLGRTEAQRAYRRVIDQYADRRDEVAVARQRLAGLSRALAGQVRRPTFTRIEIASKPQNGVLSPDGQRLVFVSDGGLWVVPLHGRVDPGIAGEPVRLANVPHIWDDYSLMSWSADGNWIAVNSMGEDEVPVYVVPASGGEPRRIEMPDRGGHAWSMRLSLSPDGRRLAFSALELGTREDVPESHRRYIYTIPTAGGDPTRVSSGWGRLPSYSPDGERIAYVGYREREDWAQNTKRSRYDGDLWVASASGENPVRLATVDGRLRGPVWSPDGRYIAAHHEPGDDNGSKAIWVFPFSPDGPSVGEPIQVALPRESGNMIAGWTPENRLAVFMESESHQAVYTVPASGGNAVQVTPEGPWFWYPRWSADGNTIYVRTVHDQVPHVRVQSVPAVGGELVDVPLHAERWLVSRVPGGGLNVSPDGDRLVVSAYQEPYDPREGADLWTIPLKGGHPTRLTSDRSYEGYPCWSPDGRTIAFTDDDESTTLGSEHSLAIYTIPAGGGDARKVASASDNVGSGGIAFSPDGARIAFFSSGTIKTVPSAGGQRAEVLVANVRSSSQSDLAWSPDGTQIAYSGAGKIWIAAVRGGASKELRTGLAEGTWLGTFGWSPDGGKIVFVGQRGGEAELWLISGFLPPQH